MLQFNDTDYTQANSTADSVKVKMPYQGRRASRENSEKRRRTILEAALRIIVKEGVRGVRHRAVAKEAQVPLSATTYYFKDISVLITDAFTLFVEQASERFLTTWQACEASLNEVLNNTDMTNSASKEALARAIDAHAINYIDTQLQQNRDFLVIEQAFQLECLRVDTLRGLAFQFRSRIIESLEVFLTRLGSANAAANAELFMSSIMRAEYLGLLSGSETVKDAGKAQIKRQLSYILSEL